jgi:Na+/H+-dicarboxylate symporter
LADREPRHLKAIALLGVFTVDAGIAAAAVHGGWFGVLTAVIAAWGGVLMMLPLVIAASDTDG